MVRIVRAGMKFFFRGGILFLLLRFGIAEGQSTKTRMVKNLKRFEKAWFPVS